MTDAWIAMIMGLLIFAGTAISVEIGISVALSAVDPALDARRLEDIVITIVTAAVGVVALAGAISGYFFTTANWTERGLLAAAAIILVFHDLRADVIGLVLLVLVSITQILRRHQTPAAITERDP